MTAGPLWLIGAGNMGGAMLRGWQGSFGWDRPVTVIDPFVANVPDGVTLLREIPPGDEQPDILVLAIKPQQLGDVRPLFANKAGAPRLLLSILAGVETQTLKEVFGADVTVRAMPNLPVSIGEGVTALYSAEIGGEARGEVAGLVASLGLVEWIDDEALFDAVTALSGCGPGFLFRFIEAMAEAGAALGLSPDQALRLATATVKGSALLAAGSDESPAILADRVASPGGSTREGLNVLDRDEALKALMRSTLSAAAKRNAELAEAARAG
ncbi:MULTISPECIES: pyrroline-5-carboxylate reductase [unclassified Sphingomonas]|uniref:pyrroline-5-carboxylate reductase n=1 Tax=unclassified Sphingomonas TaxID=196159 RepID=UPI0006FA38FC|nr:MULTISPECIES: pyrroline-5-carboxylate reductase [unclassified Sphingomonas]KQX18037.1 pyrroline-5-carboxylate reductase [Sphingomonas sp. Root1294]KQY72592.1 pyrroline-5-carboxylate reductase [Sphingomonas sp. Root50]KRB87784.1 pyrroline-5-carboxylate reductase [Sphingomonas sp. Root720]